MGATICTSLDDLTAQLLDKSDSFLHIERRASDDMVSVCLAKANQVQEQGNKALIVCADEIARQRYRAQLAAFPALDESTITTVADLSLGIIENERVSEAIGRKARVLDANEHDVLLEDMKVSGLKPGRLKEMLKFFFKSISDCENDHEGWLITSEEQQVFAILETNLEVRRALLSYELPAKAYQGMIAAGITPEPLTVIVDDYGTLSKAAQRLVGYLGTTSLIVAGTDIPALNADEDYPHYEGFANFTEEHPDACSFILATTSDDFEERSVVCTNPAEEFSFVVQGVLDQIAQGVAPHDILIATPNSTWKRTITEALSAQGVAVTPDVEPEKVKGDPRYADRCKSLKLAAFLKLYRDHQDIVALRSWLGLGDWLLRSDAFLELMAYAEEHDQNILEAITELRGISAEERSTKIFSKFDRPLEELDELQKACVSISRQGVIDLFAAHGMPLSESMVALLGDDADHADLDTLAIKAFSPAPLKDSEEGVGIATYRRCHGRHVEILFFTGLVNGFLPAQDAIDDRHSIDHKKNALERERRLFNDVETTAHRMIIRTLFEQDLLENTASMKMQTARVFVKDNTRFARIEPSEFVQTK